MLRALRIAWDRTGHTSPNPPVGAVIAMSGKIIAEGGTMPCGSSHAEIVALSSAGDPRGADMYVTLEPCSHYGRTPPCVESIIAAGIKRVICPVMDPNPLVSGKGFAALRNAGVLVSMMPGMAEAAVDLLRPFKKFISRKKPHVIYKYAAGLDGRIASVTGDSKWISCDRSRMIVHRLRAKCDAVIVGANTFIKDDPALTVRLGDFREKCGDAGGPAVMIGRENYFLRSLVEVDVSEYRQPLRVLMGLPDRAHQSARLFHDDNFIVYARRSDCDDRWVDRFGKNLVALDARDGMELANMALSDLQGRGVLIALLEGGGTLAGSFLDSGNIDQYMCFISPRVFGAGVHAMNAKGSRDVASSARLYDQSAVMIDDDLLYSAYSEPFNFERM